MKEDRIPKRVNENTLHERTVGRIRRRWKDQHAWRQNILDGLDPLAVAASDRDDKINVPEDW